MRNALCLVLLSLAACSSPKTAVVNPGPDTSGTRPAEAPDIVLLTVSGRNLDLLDLFCPPECNLPYLGDAGGAGESLQTEIESLGYTVERDDYIAALQSYDDDGDSIADRLGFLQLVSDLVWIRDNWIGTFEDPTKIVIYAHSHGCVWAHIAASVVPDCPIEVLASIDGVCLQWEADHDGSVDDYVNANGNPWPWDISSPCDEWTVPGQGDRLDTKDVVFDNVRFNLEVKSTGVNLLFGLIADTVDNRRLDGTETDITRLPAGSEGHSDVDDPGSAAYDWVVARLGEILAPPAS